MDKGIFPHRLPHTLVRRAFHTQLTLPALMEKVTQACEPLPVFKSTFLEPRGANAFSLQALGLYQQVLFTLTTKKNRPLLLIDFREGDQKHVLKLIDLLGTNLQPQRLQCPSCKVDGQKVKGYHNDLAHYLTWYAHTPAGTKHCFANSAIESAMGLSFKKFFQLEVALEQLDEKALHLREGFPMPSENVFATFERAEKPWIVQWEKQRLKLNHILKVPYIHSNLEAFLEAEEQADPRVDLLLHLTWHRRYQRYMIGWITEQAAQA